jgi:hypothetical protein
MLRMALMVMVEEKLGDNWRLMNDTIIYYNNNINNTFTLVLSIPFTVAKHHKYFPRLNF